LERRESRGAHQRSDYLDPDPSLLVNFIIRINPMGEQEISSVPVPPTPEDLLGWVKISENLSNDRRLLE
jgi:succinate dehydrogenase / fumarate reductase flavoprotein subunit